MSRPSGFVELRVDRARGLRRHTGHPLELLLRRFEEAFRRAEVPDKRTPPRRPYARQRVEDRLLRLRIPPLPVETEGEPMRFVPNTLEKLQTKRVALEANWVGPVRNEDFLLSLRQRDPCDSREVVGLHRLNRSGQLSLAPVDHDEVGRRGEPLVVLLVR